jgi:hypothetical protein
MEIDKEKQNTIEITKADNGFIVKQYKWNESDPVTEDGKDKYTETVTIIPYSEEHSEDDDNYGQKLGFINLVKHISEEFCYFNYDKWNKHNLEINFDKKGHKRDDDPTDDQ